jgi:hypothetical protein
VNTPSATSAVIFMPTHMPDARDIAIPYRPSRTISAAVPG